MASRMIGRAPCQECGFSAAHVKQSEKCLYRYCPECGAQYNTRGDRQRADLMAKTRLIDQPATTPDTASDTASAGATPAAEAVSGAPATPPSATDPSATPTAESKPAKRRGLFT